MKKKEEGKGQRRGDGLRRLRHIAREDTTKFKAGSNQIFKLYLLNQPSSRGFSSSFFPSPPRRTLFSPFVSRPSASLARSPRQEVNGQVCSCPTAAELTIRLGS